MLEDAKLFDEDGNKVAARNSGTSMVIDNETYATSLFWQPMQNQEDPYAEVGEAAQSIMEGADLFCIKQGKTPQFGICASKEGFKSGQAAAAASLASALARHSSFVGVFQVTEGWWYVCVRNDIILSDGDMLFLREADAKNQFLSMLAVPDWGIKIAPPEWNFENTHYPDLAGLLQQGTKFKLQKINGLRGTKLIVIIVIAALIGLWLLYAIIDNIFLAPPKPRIVPVTAPKMVRVIEKPTETKPWDTLYDPQEIFKQCFIDVMSLVKIQPPGWSIGVLTCDQTTASTSWTRQVGRIRWMEKALDESGLNLGRGLSDDGNTMSGSIRFEGMKQRASFPTMMSGPLKSTLNDLFQSIGQEVTLANQTTVSIEKNTYRAVKFHFISNNNPLVWNELLINFSGLSINMIKYDTKAQTWEYEGLIYAL